ncbi:MAG: hypothetical protein V4484_03290 [Pseudomonadota bacterium]
MNCATIFEEHSQVLAHWFGIGARGATLVYLDAHLDLQFIDPARIARLAACTDAGALAQLESTHCLSPDRSACYGIEDFLYPAAQLGLLQRVVWVAPPHVLRGGMAMALRALVQMEGVSIADLESFHVVAGGAIEGRLLGVDLTICVLGQLASLALSGPLLVDIDADYFVAVPADTVWASPPRVVSALRQVAGAKADVTIARSVSSGFMPLRHRFIADYLAALWEGRAADAQHWERLLDLEHHPSEAGYAEQLACRPGCAASNHALALATTDPVARATLFEKAAQLDRAYGADLLRRLGEYRARRLRLDLTTVRELQREVEACQLDAARRAIAWIALGHLYIVCGRVEQASACDAASLLLQQGGHPELALEIAKLHVAAGQFNAALACLERAAADDETRVGAWLYMAECAHAMGQHQRATDVALRAARAAPAWPLVPQRMAAFAGARGDAVQAGSLLAQHGALERRIATLVARLS